MYHINYNDSHVYTHVNISELCPLRGSRSNDTPVAMSTHSTQILVSNTILQLKEKGLPGEIAVSWTEAGNVQDESGAPCKAKKQGGKKKIRVCQGDPSTD